MEGEVKHREKKERDTAETFVQVCEAVLVSRWRGGRHRVSVLFRPSEIQKKKKSYVFQNALVRGCASFHDDRSRYVARQST